MKLDRKIKRLTVALSYKVFSSHSARKLIPREIVQFLFHKKGYTNYMPDVSLLGRSVVSDDPIRYAHMLLALERIKQRNVPGAFAELGVYKGISAKYISEADKTRTFYLFDTFKGFGSKYEDDRFQDTSVEEVRAYLNNADSLVFRKGFFPETAQGLENETFAFVMLDADKYEPTFAGLEYFWPRINPGGYLFAHDYNSPESNWAVRKAFKNYFGNEVAPIVDLPDKGGSVCMPKV